MKRREFITLLGGAAAAWTRAAADDTGDGFPTQRITGFTHMAAAFGQGVKEKGSIDGQNVTRRA